jgi:subtilisin family serine protease
MKNLTIIIILILMTTVVKGQNNSASGELFHPNTKATNYKPGEILVKFKDNATIIPLKSGGMMKTGVAYVDSLSMKWGITGIAQVFRNTQKLKALQIVTLPDGKQKTLSQVFNIYKITFPGEKDAQLVVDDFKKLANVDYAELNGTASIVGGIATSEPFYDPASAMGQKVSAKNAKATTLNKPNDPLYNQQWYIPEIKADSLWNITTGDTTQVIGILDTGVDWHHPDLANKIWINTKEIPNNGIDDDGNGYIDDVRGWDFVNNDNNPMDDNSHGTHCAGIAAAETNNGIGIAGVSWGAKVMPIKVFQSNGIGYFSQIAEGFWYAAKNGCTIFSNSWSSTGESITIRLAMEYAYSKGLIVAAAGNMNTKTDQPCPPWPPYEPNFPACYNWVLGVEATDQTGNNAWFSNFDPTGPIISDSRPYGGIYYNDFDYNYEMRAPGVSFMSTVPNGQYRSYSGTSMACPLVAGSIALMKSYDPKLSNEQVFAKLIQTIKISKMQAGVLNILKCTLINPPPDLYYVKNSIADSLNGGDNDGRPDAGETIDMHITVKNAGGKGDSIYTKIRFSEFEDKSVAKIIKTTCFLGNLSAYAKQTSLDAIKIKIDSNVVDARIISFQLLIYQKNSKDTVYQNLTISVEHGIEIKRTYSKLHLTGNAYYLVTEASVIDSLIIDPGVTLRFKNNAFLMIIKYMYAVGNPENMITFKGADDSFVHSITMANNAYSNFSYCIFQDGAPIWNTYLVNPTKIYNSIFRNNSSKSLFSFKKGGDYQYNVFTDNSFNWSSNEFSLIPIWELATFKNNILASNTNLNKTAAMMFYGHHLDYPMCMDSIVDNVFLNNEKYSCSSSDWNGWPMGHYKFGFNKIKYS